MIKKKMESGNVCIGSWMQIPAPSIAEIAAQQSIDWIAVDMEHTEIGYETLADIFRALNGSDTSPVVRVRSNDALDIRRALDIGAEGIIVPLIHTAAEAKKAVSYCKYPPEGVRGYSFCRANNWGDTFDKYVRDANENTAVFVMAESREAVENIDSILDVEGIDGIFIGPYDMSASYGVVGQTDHPLVKAGCKIVLEACRTRGKIAGIHMVMPDEVAVRENIKKGFKLIAVGIDTLFLINGFKDIKRLG
jgi:2-keto-3-deoxy-L-rhamnonate aldolase RhmA